MSATSVFHKLKATSVRLKGRLLRGCVFAYLYINLTEILGIFAHGGDCGMRRGPLSICLVNSFNSKLSVRISTLCAYFPRLIAILILYIFCSLAYFKCALPTALWRSGYLQLVVRNPFVICPSASAASGPVKRFNSLMRFGSAHICGYMYIFTCRRVYLLYLCNTAVRSIQPLAMPSPLHPDRPSTMWPP